MGRYLAFPLLILAAVFQTTVIPLIRIGEGAPSLILLIVVSWALLTGMEDGLVWAVLGGLAQDLLGGTPFGVASTALVMTLLVISFISPQITKNNILIPLIAIAVGTTIYYAVLIIVLILLGQSVPLGYAIGSVMLPSLGYNVLFILPIFRLIGGLSERVSPRTVNERFTALPRR
jgi:rod shape-determining protein MreD